MAEIICNPLLRKMQSDLNHVLSNESSDINHRLDPRLSKHIVITPSRHVRTRLYFTSESHIHCMINILRYGGLFGVRLASICVSIILYCVQCIYMYICTWSQDNPEAQSKGWMKLSATPDLNFLSQIVLMLFEDESEPLDSPCRYYVNLHIGSGVKARKLSMINSALFIGEEMHSPSFVKRLPADTNILHVGQSTPGVRKVSSSPTMRSETQPLSVETLHQRKTSKSISVIPNSSVLPKSSPESQEKMSITYESLQTMGESGIYILYNYI